MFLQFSCVMTPFTMFPVAPCRSYCVLKRKKSFEITPPQHTLWGEEEAEEEPEAHHAVRPTRDCDCHFYSLTMVTFDVFPLLLL